jgi:hypothetical protein
MMDTNDLIGDLTDVVPLSSSGFLSCVKCKSVSFVKGRDVFGELVAASCSCTSVISQWYSKDDDEYSVTEEEAREQVQTRWNSRVKRQYNATFKSFGF